ncbi:MAG: N-acetylglutaminylglutamine amidotransferase [Pseudomonadota bacterium]
MCGICGEFRFDGAAPDADALARMTAALERRGPDDSGQHIDGPVGFGHRRLSIIDLSSRAHQPMIDDDNRLAIVFNGSIYNYPALREELIARGHSFKSSGDTEVILKAFAEWGTDCVARLSGMFAFAIWDARAQSIFLARDRMGIKPLYFTQDAKRVRFASTPQALTAGGGVDTDIDPVALHNQFMLHAVVPAPRTLLKSVRKMRPAHHALIDRKGKWDERRYWTLRATRPSEHRDDEEWIERVHDALRTAVKRRLEIADVPVGVLLSGGLDSSLLVALLSEAGATNLKTFTVGFDDQPEEKGSEFEYSDPVVDKYGTDHHKFFVPNADLIPRVPEAVAAMAEPMFGQDAVAFYLLAEQVSKKVKVVQSGQGADEVFAGYFWYPKIHTATDESGVSRFANRYFDREHTEWLDFIDPAHHTPNDETRTQISAMLDSIDADEYLDRVLALDVTTLIVDDPVKRVDNMTMAWGLEARVPFLDHELVELAAQIPPELKLRDGGKYPLKRVARGRVPDAVIDRKKGYFPVPALKYVRGEFLGFMRDILNSSASRNRGLYQQSFIDRLLDAPESHLTRLEGSKLWHAALLELWLQTHIDTP